MRSGSFMASTCTLMEITLLTGKREVEVIICTAVLSRHDVLHVEGKGVLILVKRTVFAAKRGSFPYEGAGRFIHYDF